jgi:hypothetical protein
MRHTLLFVIGFAWCLTSKADGDRRAPEPPRVFQFDGRRIAEARHRVGAGDGQLRKALDRLRAKADTALRTPPLTVVEKPQLPPSGDRHDYLSLAPYWWPDPGKPDGKPYVRKDGRTNPERGRYDAPKLARLGSAAPTLALAYALTGHEPYAEHAARLLRAWFLDPRTRMNSNLNFGQFVPGRNDGRGSGIIETRGLLGVVDAVGLLEGSKSWGERDTAGMRAWFRDYLAWLRTSEVGRAEDRARNNHGSWYDAQVVTYALFVGEDRLAREVLEAAKGRRVARQVEPDGRQPLELTRTRSFGYCVFNLEALTTLADLGDRAGVDLWRYRTADGRSIRAAVDWLIPYATGARRWPYEQITAARADGLLLPLRRAAGAYHEPAYERDVGRLIAGGARPDEAFELLHPPPTAE